MTHDRAGTILLHLRRVLHAESATALTDAQLLGRFTAGRDEAAFAALVLRHGSIVLGTCRRVLRNHHDAEDAFQATFLVLARLAGSIRKQESVASWLYGVAFRTAMKVRRGLARRQARERQAPSRQPTEVPSELALRDLQQVLDEEVARLPGKLRAAFVLCCLECKSRADAARELDWNEGTLASRLAQARQRLRQRLLRRGVSLSAALSALALSDSAGAAAVSLVFAEPIKKLITSSRSRLPNAE